MFILDTNVVSELRKVRTWLESHVLPAFAGRILPVDVAVAQRCAALAMESNPALHQRVINTHYRSDELSLA